jgi:predicted porin
MNKKLMAVAIVGALSAPGFAAAQVGSSPGVTLYGTLDSTIMSNSYAEQQVLSGTPIGKVTKGDVFTAGNEMGVRGREAIGGGTSVWFQLATGVWPDARLEGSTTTGNNWGGRNSALGVSSSLGDILWGIWDTPYKTGIYTFGNVISSGPFGHGGVIIGNGDSTGALPNAQCGGLVNNGTGAVRANTVCVVEVTANGSAFSARRSNSVQWWSPNFSGVQVKLMTAMYNYKNAETQPLTNGMQSTQEYSGSVTFARGPLSLGVAVDQRKGFNASNAANGIVDPKDTGVILGGKWNFGPGQIGVTFEQLDYGANTTAANPGNKMKVTNTAINGRWRVGPGDIWAGYSFTPGGKSCGTEPTATALGTSVSGASCGDPGKANVVSVGYDYILSKRSKIYVAYEKIDNGEGSGYYYIAGPAANAVGTGGALARGTDVTTLGVGIRHTF